MTGLPFPWIFAGVAAVVDVVGLFYLWRRRKYSVNTNHKPGAAERLRRPLAERRRSERRAAGRVASA